MSDSAQTSSRPLLLRGLAELIVIIVGVLVALSLENWWAEREERSLEAGYIDALHDEARTQLQALTANRAVHNRKLAALTSAATLLDAPFEPDATPELFYGLFQGSGIPVVPEFSTAIFFDLQSSGRLRLISDDELRRAAIAHYARIPAMLERARSWTEATDATLHAFISSRAPVGSVIHDGPTLDLDWSGVGHAEIAEIGAEIHGHPDIRRLVQAQARQLEHERGWLEIVTTGIENYAQQFDAATR